MKPTLTTSWGSPLPSVFGPDTAGQYPFLRGIYPGMYRDKVWTMRQYAGFGTADETNHRFRYLLEQGQMGLSVAFDLPTQMGYDSDHPMALGEVGKTGVAIDTVADMERLFDGIPLDKVSTSMTINAPAGILLAMYVVAAERQGVASAKLTGTIQNDVLKEFIARHTYIFPPAPSMRFVADVFGWCAEHTPKWNPISISGYHMREAGCTAVQEVAFTLANGLAYLRAAQDKGLAVDKIAPRLSFFFSAMPRLIEEVAKFRAARRLWAKLVRERLGAQDDRSCLLRFHVQTAGSSLADRQMLLNVSRTTVEALAAVLGGAQSLHTNGHDEAVSLPSEESARTALRIQQFVAFETDAAAMVDPLGGSHAVEALTDQIEQEALALIDRMDQMGGVAVALDKGFQKDQIEEASYRHQLALEKGDEWFVGVNCFQIEEPPPVVGFRHNPESEVQQVQLLKARRQLRDQARINQVLGDLKVAAAGSGNVMPLVLEACRAEASVGEISDALRQVWGHYRP